MMEDWKKDPIVPRCTRGPHHCVNLCPSAFGEPCTPPLDRQFDWWILDVRPGPGRRYRALKKALAVVCFPGLTVDEALAEPQERYIRWLAETLDDEGIEIMSSLFVGGVR